jgi:hypothetical protein
MKRLLPIAVAVALAGVLRAQEGPAPAAGTGVADGTVLRRARIPTAESAHGETRLIRRDGGACVQTLLHTSALRRGVHEMLKKEQAAWPAGAAGHEDSLAYRAALEDAKQHVLANASTNAPADGRVSLLMEVSLTPDAAGCAFYDAAVSREDGEFVVSDKTLIATMPASRYYVSRAMRFMTAAAFHIPDVELTNVLHSAGWEPVPPPAGEVAP